jgi:hypothetical protein
MLTWSILPRRVWVLSNGVVGIRERFAVVTVVLAAVITLSGCTSAESAGISAEPSDSAVSTTAVGDGVGAPDNPAPAPTSAAPKFTTAVVQLAPGVSDEASGIAASTTRPGAFFLVDDASRTTEIAAVAGDGSVIKRISVDNMSAGNSEALASGTCGPAPLRDGSMADTCLYVGDIGDNKSKRDHIAVYRFAEPDLDPAAADSVSANEWIFTYPDGPQNAEALMVAPDGTMIIVTKPGTRGTPPHKMYRADPGGGELRLVREFRPPDPEQPLRTLFTGNVVTDLAYSPGRVLLLTYDELQEYRATDPTADISTFPDWPHHRLPLPPMPQAEGVTPTVDGCGYAVASESGPGGDNGSMAIVSCD